jgi:hypothetical protein
VGWAIAWGCLGFAMVMLARISRRMGQYTHARRYYRLLYIAACLCWLGTLFHTLLAFNGLAQFSEIVQNSVYVLLADGMPALGLVIALGVAWYYWSWLLAERD